MATASFNTDSPNSSASKFGSTLRSLKTARTVTGSVAEIIAPNCKQWPNFMSCGANEANCESKSATKDKDATQNVEIIVPTNAEEKTIQL